ncbi:MAG: TetR family transcriptional regulator [Verrucomicrobia bacterium]|jgi:AcrR family transcriptional regulator|nr:TetR family transcriptional regulator [Verrucomicrobiota bacterium]
MRKTNLKPHIIETAGGLFARKGYGNVGINEILKAGEIARASFYHHFESKEALCAAWLESLHERSVNQHRALLESRKKPATIVRDYFKALKNWLIENDYRGCPYSNTGTFLQDEAPRIRAAIERHKIFLRDFFIGLAQRIRPGGGRELGEQLFLLYSGATTEAQNLRTTWPIDRAARASERLCTL